MKLLNLLGMMGGIIATISAWNRKNYIEVGIMIFFVIVNVKWVFEDNNTVTIEDVVILLKNKLTKQIIIFLFLIGIWFVLWFVLIEIMIPSLHIIKG